MDTESDDTEKSVNYAEQWSSYVERYTNPATGPSAIGNQNGPSSNYGKSENKSSMDTTGGGAGSADGTGTETSSDNCSKNVNSEGGAASAKEPSSKKQKGPSSASSKDSEDSVSFSKSYDASSLSSGAPLQHPPSTNTSSSYKSSSGGEGSGSPRGGCDAVALRPKSSCITPDTIHRKEFGGSQLLAKSGGGGGGYGLSGVLLKGTNVKGVKSSKNSITDSATA